MILHTKHDINNEIKGEGAVPQNSEYQYCNK